MKKIIYHNPNDAENFDINTLINSLNLPDLDNAGIIGMFDSNGFDLSELLNNIVSMFMEKTLPEATQE